MVDSRRRSSAANNRYFTEAAVYNPCLPANHARPESRGLSVEELCLLTAYRQLPPVTRLATRRYVFWGDIRLVRAIYHRVFMNITLSHLRDQPPD